MNSRIVALLTGGTGYLGSHLARRLVGSGWDIHLAVRSSSCLEPIRDIREGVRLHQLDGTTERLCGIMTDVKPDVVIHLASLFLARHSVGEVAPMIDSNIRFSCQLAEAMVHGGARRLINTDTAWQHFDDTDYNPVCLYAATKQAFQSLLRYYAEVENLHVLTLELFDTYGPGDPRPKLLNLLHRAAQRGETLEMSPGHQKIDLVYLDDVLNAYALAARRLLRGEGGQLEERFVIRTGRAVSLRELVAMCGKAWKLPLNINWGGRSYRPREVMQPWSGGNVLPGWSAAVGLETGLVNMIADHEYHH